MRLRQYDIRPAVLPASNRVYADRTTQAEFDAWTAAARGVARMFTESTGETGALREQILRLTRPE
jgi:hypothetical protein